MLLFKTKKHKELDKELDKELNKELEGKNSNTHPLNKFKKKKIYLMLCLSIILGDTPIAISSCIINFPAYGILTM